MPVPAAQDGAAAVRPPVRSMLVLERSRSRQRSRLSFRPSSLRPCEGDMSKRRARSDDEAKSGQLGSFRWVVGAATIAWTEGLCRLLSVDRAQAATSVEALEARIHADDRRYFSDLLRIASTNGCAQAGELRALAGDGRTIRCRIEMQPEFGPGGEVAALIGVVQDITEDRPTEEALRRSQALLQAVIDAVPALISVTDADGRYVFVNAYS